MQRTAIQQFDKILYNDFSGYPYRHDPHSLCFSISYKSDLRIHSANLHFYIDPNTHIAPFSGETFVLSKFETDGGITQISSVLVLSEESHRRWHTFRITHVDHLYVPQEPAVLLPSNTSHQNVTDGSADLMSLNMMITCVTCDDSEPPFFLTSSPRPYLEIKAEKQNHRAKRDLEACEPGPNSCCKVNKNVTIAELGWDWIIQPQVIQANYCAGRCRSECN